jgi:hypothetical protein
LQRRSLLTDTAQRREEYAEKNCDDRHYDKQLNDGERAANRSASPPVCHDDDLAPFFSPPDYRVLRVTEG